VDRPIERLVLLPFERVEDLLAREHATRGAGEDGQELELVVRQEHALAVDDDLARAEVDLELARAEAGTTGGDRRRPAQHGADARQELPWIERLGEVIVRPELEADDLVDVFAARGQHD